jgi:cytochrome c oxidase cbb3-type subunit III
MSQTRLALVAVAVAALLGAAPIHAAGQNVADVAPGKKLFEGMCARCHGIDGTGEEGPNLNRPTLSRAADDDALRDVIRDGIPDRGMPRVRRLTDGELNQLVAYVRSLGRTAVASTKGNAERGGAIYGRLGCASCHIIKGVGGSFGPDLTEIGMGRGAGYLRQSFLGPAEMLPHGSSIPGRGFTEYLPVHVITSDGRDVVGVRINEDPFTIQVRDTGNRFHSFRKSELKELDKQFGKSLMPSFRGRLTDTESEDLVAYLSSLRGVR